MNSLRMKTLKIFHCSLLMHFHGHQDPLGKFQKIVRALLMRKMTNTLSAVFQSQASQGKFLSDFNSLFFPLIFLQSSISNQKETRCLTSQNRGQKCRSIRHGHKNTVFRSCLFIWFNRGAKKEYDAELYSIRPIIYFEKVSVSYSEINCIYENKSKNLMRIYSYHHIQSIKIERMKPFKSIKQIEVSTEICLICCFLNLFSKSFYLRNFGLIIKILKSCFFRKKLFLVGYDSFGLVLEPISFFSQMVTPALNPFTSYPIIILLKMHSQNYELQMIQEQESCHHDLFDTLVEPCELCFKKSQESLSIDSDFSMVATQKTSIESSQDRTVKTVFCTCSKSKCNQKYCPCLKAGQKCGSSCICLDCKNELFVPRRVKYTLGSVEQLSLPTFSFSE